ncbi:MAG: MarR family transcriptional regulator [Myxococcota bacterium]
MADDAPAPLDELIDEVRLLWNALVQRAERLHRGSGVTVAMRAVLEFLARAGPTSVPHVARARRVSRQHIQAIANALVERGLVATDANPAHRRSPLLRLTPKGARAIARMQDREQTTLAAAAPVATPAELARAAATLRKVRGALEGRAAGLTRP